jgi:transcriptional regulator with XRE-family HTH domain
MTDIDSGEEPQAPSIPAVPSRPRARLRTPVDHQRSEFLRRCRGRIKPEDVGLPAAGRSRTGGLRREDVAALSGVSASWYTWLEQGRDIRVSDDVLERISQTLRLSADERIYLFSLVQHRPPRLGRDTHDEAPPELLRMVQSLPVPSVVFNLRWDVVAWNDANCAIYRDYSLLPPGERNLLEILLTKPVKHMTQAQLEMTMQRLIARMRFDYTKCADDPKFEVLFRRLVARSPLFARLWRSTDFTLRSYGLHRFTHARFGALAFEHTSYVPDGNPYMRVVICTPENTAAKRAVATVNAEVAAREAEARERAAPAH